MSRRWRTRPGVWGGGLTFAVGAFCALVLRGDDGDAGFFFLGWAVGFVCGVIAWIDTLMR